MPSVHTPRSFRGDGAVDPCSGEVLHGWGHQTVWFSSASVLEALEKLEELEVRLLPSSLWVTLPWPQRCMCPKHRTPNCWLLASPGLQRRDPRQWSRWRDHSDAPRVRRPVPQCAAMCRPIPRTIRTALGETSSPIRSSNDTTPRPRRRGDGQRHRSLPFRFGCGRRRRRSHVPVRPKRRPSLHGVEIYIGSLDPLWLRPEDGDRGGPTDAAASAEGDLNEDDSTVSN